jgi:hypothetical protein
VAYNFHTGSNKIKLLMEYESVTKKVYYIRIMEVKAVMNIPSNSNLSYTST